MGLYYFDFTSESTDYTIYTGFAGFPNTNYSANATGVIMGDDGFSSYGNLYIEIPLGVVIESIVITPAFVNSFTEKTATLWELEAPFPYPTGTFTATVTFSGGGVEVISSPFNKLWSVDFDTMKDLSEISEWRIGGNGAEKVDLSGFIIKVLAIPFEIPEEFLFDGADQPIQIGGNGQTTVAAPVIISDVITYDLGVINVLGVRGNSLDYTNKQFELILPMMDEIISLEGSEIIGIDLKVTAILDAYSGDVTINLFRNEDEKPFKAVKTSMGRGLPIQISNNLSPSDVSGNYGSYNGTMKAYIRVTENELFESEFNNLISVSENIGLNTGYIKVSDIKLLCNSTSEEKEMIISQLNEGVMINV